MDDDEDNVMTEEELERYIAWEYEHFKNYETRDPSMPPSVPPKKKDKKYWTLWREREKKKRVV